MTNEPIPVIETATVSGMEVHRLIDKMEPALENEPIATVIIACLTIALMAQNPYLTVDELEKGVCIVSQGLALFAAEKGLAMEDVPKGKLN